MLRIGCPVCGLRDETEFVYGGDATVAASRPHGETDAEEWSTTSSCATIRAAPHREYWHHAAGCRQWLVVERDT